MTSRRSRRPPLLCPQRFGKALAPINAALATECVARGCWSMRGPLRGLIQLLTNQRFGGGQTTSALNPLSPLTCRPEAPPTACLPSQHHASCLRPVGSDAHAVDRFAVLREDNHRVGHTTFVTIQDGW